jgi:hypothetical protein
MIQREQHDMIRLKHFPHHLYELYLNFIHLDKTSHNFLIKELNSILLDIHKQDFVCILLECSNNDMLVVNSSIEITITVLNSNTGVATDKMHRHDNFDHR